WVGAGTGLGLLAGVWPAIAASSSPVVGGLGEDVAWFATSWLAVAGVATAAVGLWLRAAPAVRLGCLQAGFAALILLFPHRVLFDAVTVGGDRLDQLAIVTIAAVTIALLLRRAQVEADEVRTAATWGAAALAFLLSSGLVVATFTPSVA